MSEPKQFCLCLGLKGDQLRASAQSSLLMQMERMLESALKLQGP